MNCPLLECKERRKEGDCDFHSCRNYIYYRRRTGKCSICGQPMKEHPLCKSCGILCGNNHVEVSLLPNGLCSFCDALRKRLLRIVKGDYMSPSNSQRNLATPKS